MISQEELNRTYDHACVPEHIVDYVVSMSEAEPYLIQHYLCYKKDGVLIFIGYPLGIAFNQKQMETSLNMALKAIKPRIVSVIAPTTVTMNGRVIQQNSDSYYRLDLENLVIPSKVRNMIRRASPEISVEHNDQWHEEHEDLVAEFLATHKISAESQRIFIKISEYVSSSKSVTILNARNNEGLLIAFDVADYGSRNYASYMFNFASRKHHVPGVSDLLLSEIIESARRKGKRYINLGLAINNGVMFFKQKWGGAPFLNHEFMLYEISRAGIIESLLSRL
ncbi:MAG TPA: phosphatidylglycerol lysyltransferase domain-containing protein [Syntrophorhabdus sp.]|nr:phosphatidylglycerol lysyltransferase domain-containing protein [Syntrophorhabdus sp.]